METSQLSRMHTSEARNTPAQSPGQSDDTAESNAFDRRLNDQIEQSRSAEKAADTRKNNEKTDEKQSPDQKDGSESAGEGTQQPVKQAAVERDAGDEPVSPAKGELEARTAGDMPGLMAGVDSGDPRPGEAAVTPDDAAVGEQSLPQAGKTLPLDGEAVKTAGAPVEAVVQGTQVNTGETQGTRSAEKAALIADSARQAQAQAQAQPQPQPQPQPAAVRTPQQGGAFAPDGADFVPAEPGMPGRAGKQAVDGDGEPVLSRGKAALAMSAASAASIQQQVPLTTSLAGMHHHPGAAPTGLDASMTSSNPFPTTLSSSLGTPVQNPAWSQGVAERVAWMVQGQFQTAELKLNPANLGPLEIRLSVHDDNKASITFVTQHGSVRDALDAAMPRLREMLESQGLDLSDVNVSDSGVQGHQQQAADSESAQSGGVADPGPGESTGDEALMQESMVQVDRATGVSIYA